MEIGGICIDAEGIVNEGQYSEELQGTGFMVDPCMNCQEVMDQYGLNSAEFMCKKSEFFEKIPIERPKAVGEVQVGFTIKLEMSARKRKGWTYMES